MTFRKNSLNFYESEIIYISVAILSLALIPTMGLELSLVCMLPMTVFALITPALHREYITIDELGITCHKAGVTLWAYKWNDIAELRKSSRYKLPSIEVLPYDRDGNPEHFNTAGHYFQLGQGAKKALKKYRKFKDGSLNN